ncbi:MAG: CoA-binding protein [Candidatus Peribacteria bacterium]|nr:MAG: CoA-binding protein [Candidatus Peribacteria bacterium]
MKDLVVKGYTVYPVNPKESKIEGITAYSTLADISEKYEVVNFVVPPAVTLRILEENREILKGKKIWCQPGSSDEEVKQFLEDHGFEDYITDSCIMLTNLS